MSISPIPLYYTFGNHMHWVDMEWLWGYFVLPSSVRDMLHFCNETGAKGNVNFDGIGYEKLAVEAPEALAELRSAVQAGQVEVVGASYGQPYGLFHHGESNIRQRIYGVRTVIRLLGVRPRSFWEEEFDFFPQLPQMLAGAGFRYASLFFQWTWHTPHMPLEELPAIWWEGQDGSKILAAPRNALNLHQWPEDFAGLLEQPLVHEMPTPGVTLTAWYRETSEGGRGLDQYAGTGIEHPMVLRLVEFAGFATTARIRVPGEVAVIFQTNLMGEIERQIEVQSSQDSMSSALRWSEFSISLEAYQITTLYIDLVLARKVPRDLDSYRSVWATVHRVE